MPSGMITMVSNSIMSFKSEGSIILFNTPSAARFCSDLVGHFEGCNMALQFDIKWILIEALKDKYQSYIRY